MMITPASMIPRYLAVGFLLATAAILSLSCSRKQSELTDSTNLEPESTNIEAKRMINIPLQDPREAVFMTAIGAINPEQALATSAAFAADKAGFFALLEQAEADSASAGDFLQLVDKTHGLAADYEPADLVSLNEYPLRVGRVFGNER